MQNGCVYQTFYTAGNASGYAGFVEALCGLPPSTPLKRMNLPLSEQSKALFDEAASVLIPEKSWVKMTAWDGSYPGDYGTTAGVQSSAPYAILNTFYMGLCQDLPVSLACYSVSVILHERFSYDSACSMRSMQLLVHAVQYHSCPYPARYALYAGYQSLQL